MGYAAKASMTTTSAGIDTGAMDYQLYALSTFPDLQQEVHTYIFFAAPLTLTETCLILDFHILLLLLWEWLTLFPK